jgi:hypothetical protein
MIRLDRRRGLWIAGAAALALFVALGAIDLRIQDTGGPGIVEYEFSGSEERVAEALAEWGEGGADDARLSLWLDYAFMLAYAAFLTLAVLAARDAARRRGWVGLARAGSVLAYFPPAAAAFDALENVGLLVALEGNGGDIAPLLAAICAALKFALAGAATVYLVATLARIGLARSGRETSKAEPG